MAGTLHYPQLSMGIGRMRAQIEIFGIAHRHQSILAASNNQQGPLIQAAQVRCRIRLPEVNSSLFWQELTSAMALERHAGEHAPDPEDPRQDTVPDCHKASQR
jgi:hypothetical protein